jgi:hypothetical protein
LGRCDARKDRDEGTSSDHVSVIQSESNVGPIQISFCAG